MLAFSKNNDTYIIRSLSRLLRNILVILVSGLSFSCANINQNYSLLINHFSILKKAKSISDLKKNDSFNPDLKKRLELIQEIKSFAVKNLSLKKMASKFNF